MTPTHQRSVNSAREAKQNGYTLPARIDAHGRSPDRFDEKRIPEQQMSKESQRRDYGHGRDWLGGLYDGQSTGSACRHSKQRAGHMHVEWISTVHEARD